MLGPFNNYNILKSSHKEKSSEEIDKIHHVVVCGINENMAELVQNYQYSAINTTYTSTMGYYVIKFMSETYILEEEKMCDGKISTSGELYVKPQYTNCTQDNTKWY